jgi:hypothetical protein
MEEAARKTLIGVVGRQVGWPARSENCLYDTTAPVSRTLLNAAQIVGQSSPLRSKR